MQLGGFLAGAVVFIYRFCSKPLSAFVCWSRGPIDERWPLPETTGFECFREGSWSEPSFICIGFVQTRFRFVGGGLGARSMSNKPFQKREGANANLSAPKLDHQTKAPVLYRTDMWKKEVAA